jgi:hypothetical protein
MNEEGKLEEAAHFLGQMRSSLQHPDVFRYNLSAFLSAARSVAQYALKEAQTKPGGQAWFDRLVEQDKLIGFFASRRNANIHDEPVQLDGHVDVYVKDAAYLSERAVVEKFDREGNLVEVVEGEPPRPATDSEWTPDLAFVPHYTFAQWQGSEEIPELCERYLAALRRLVIDGRARGMLSTPEHAA